MKLFFKRLYWYFKYHWLSFKYRKNEDVIVVMPTTVILHIEGEPDQILNENGPIVLPLSAIDGIEVEL